MGDRRASREQEILDRLGFPFRPPRAQRAIDEELLRRSFYADIPKIEPGNFDQLRDALKNMSVQLGEEFNRRLAAAEAEEIFYCEYCGDPLQDDQIDSGLCGDCDDPDYERADGDMICNICGKEYWRHALHPRYDWLRALCNGEFVKL